MFFEVFFEAQENHVANSAAKSENAVQEKLTRIFCTGREFDLTMFFKAWSNMVSISEPCFSFLFPGIKNISSQSRTVTLSIIQTCSAKPKKFCVNL